MALQASSMECRQLHSPTRSFRSHEASGITAPNARSDTPTLRTTPDPPRAESPSPSSSPSPPPPPSPSSSSSSSASSSDPIANLSSGSSSGSSFRPTPSPGPRRNGPVRKTRPGNRTGAGVKKRRRGSAGAERMERAEKRRKANWEARMRRLDREDWRLIRGAKREGGEERGVKRKRR